ncbi:hypothetical protein QZQ41_13750 [Serratia marcescens]|uniref:hypothetical protein n=1 Tax=Serratia marcescens TaxID=615 RepID=UPI0018D9D760|nr:hypothetical protein [Serratia marcescens]MBH3133646.1 hypothetical protein [Serratia marcescens]MDP8610527.1 hypothetical protein [Serratia marcescens]MDP8615658.1 hypothetical protein [Serratia marcescens]MDP8645709.1 hypothetical protein [Serratia marcescens]MDP8655652.1 hypothetical protein [Serratia marcescens]
MPYSTDKSGNNEQMSSGDSVETIEKNPKSWIAWKRETERLQTVINDLNSQRAQPTVEPIYLRQFSEGLSVGWEVVNKMRYDNAAPGMRRIVYPEPLIAPAKVIKCLSFFASAIKSGEPWTETCQRDYDAALRAAGQNAPPGHS